MSKAVVLLSGGLDSTVATYWAVNNYDEVECISFNYGNRAQIELEYAKKTANELGLKHKIIDLKDLRQLMINEDGSVPPEAPYRNLIFLLMASSLAVGINAEAIIIGDHEDDVPDFMDSKPSSIMLLDQLIFEARPKHATEDIGIIRPLIGKNKAQVIELGCNLGVLFKNSMSCYHTVDNKHCGECTSCIFRKKAFNDACILDPTEYIV